MKEVFIQKIKTILNSEKTQLLNNNLQNFDIDQEGDDCDKIQAGILVNVQNQLSSRNQEKLKRIESTFEKIADGSFGNCEECGEQIAEKRLLFNPLFITCISCAEQLEFERRNYKKG